MEKNRLEAFSDGVFAIAITLLVLEIKLPHVPRDQLGAALRALGPKLLAYALSFGIIGVYWVAHHHMFHFFRRVDRNALWLNNLTLLCVAFLPFPAALLGEYPGAAEPLVIYGATLVCTNGSGALLWIYSARGRRLVDPGLGPAFVRFVAAVHSAPMACYAVAMACAPLWPRISYAIYLAVPLFFILPNPLLARRLAKARG